MVPPASRPIILGNVPERLTPRHPGLRYSTLNHCDEYLYVGLALLGVSQSRAATCYQLLGKRLDGIGIDRSPPSRSKPALIMCFPQTGATAQGRRLLAVAEL